MKNSPARVLILGLDPGLRHTGWGIIQMVDNTMTHVGHGVVNTPTKLTLAERLNCLYQGLSAVIDDYAPCEAVVEETFVNKNPASTLKLGMARGVVLLVPASKGLPVFEYSANRIKKSVVGVGHADKNQVLLMVQRLLPCMKRDDMRSDAADALAAAICHAHYRRINSLVRAQI
ncbi:MAG: crossover junction endodeoxyribonuclease RuvC [Alphaproteobacteria bacterium]|nr:crossover junction endodeoxyribonuclease RuvC [Alphaproteobacteria bacterium]